jgi:hypothetical protein
MTVDHDATHDDDDAPFTNLPATAEDNAAIADILGAFGNLGALGSAESLPFLGLDAAGRWKYGQDSIQPEPGALWGVDLKSAKWGYVAWVDNKPAGQFMCSVSEKRPRTLDLDEPTLPWQDQVSFEMTCLTGDDAGTRVLFKQSSDGGKRAFLNLINTAKQTLRTPQALKNYVPVVQLDKETYFHEGFKRDVTKPLLKLVSWGPGSLLQLDDGAIAAIPLPKPNGAKAVAPAAPKAKAAAAAPAAAAEPSPSGRRRRVGA